MSASPWRTFGSPEPNGDFVALLSYLPLKSYWRVPPFVFYTAQVMKQLASARGSLGYSLLARPLSKRFWTLSSWEDKMPWGVSFSTRRRINASWPRSHRT